MTNSEKAREVRLRRTAQRQGLTLRKSRTRDPRAIGHGLFHMADENNVAVAGYGLWGYSMSLDEVEIYLADAQDLDVRFENFTGSHDPDDMRPFLWWQAHYRVGGRAFSGWMLAERADTFRDHFIGSIRSELAHAAMKARDVLRQWAGDTEH